MPTGIVENEDDDAVAASRRLFGEGRQQGFEEWLRNAIGNIPEAFAGGGRDEGGDVEPFEAVMPVGDGAHAHRRPDAAYDGFQADPVLVRREGLDGDAGMGFRLFGDDLGDFYGMARPSLRRGSLAAKEAEDGL